MSVIKNIAITEPLVDVVEGKAVVSSTVPILNLDLLTCTKEDCDFKSPFILKCIRNDFCHAFVAYFECAFTQVHKPIAFTTSPFATYTHWKQTVSAFYRVFYSTAVDDYDWPGWSLFVDFRYFISGSLWRSVVEKKLKDKFHANATQRTHVIWTLKSTSNSMANSCSITMQYNSTGYDNSSSFIFRIFLKNCELLPSLCRHWWYQMPLLASGFLYFNSLLRWLRCSPARAFGFVNLTINWIIKIENPKTQDPSFTEARYQLQN